jgi:hypothetical protein
MTNFWLRSPLMEEAGQDGGGGGGGTPTFDPTRFRSDILADVNKSINGAMARLEKMLKPKPEETPKPDTTVETDTDEGGDKSKPTDPKVKALEKRLADMAAKWEASEKARQETETRAKAEKLNGTLRTELLKYVPAERIDAALRIFGPDVRYAEDGTIVGGADELPLSEFVEAAIQKHEYLLPPKQVGGAGATAGTRRGQQSVDLNEIKPGMKPEDLARVREAIARAAADMGQGR